MRPGPAHRGPAGHHCGRGRALAPWDPAPRPPDASRDPSSPLGLVGVLAPHMSPAGRTISEPDLRPQEVSTQVVLAAPRAR